jgi:hypothetical protein
MVVHPVLMPSEHPIPGTPESYGRFLPRAHVSREPIRQGQVGIVPREGGLLGSRDEVPAPSPDELDALFASHIAEILAVFAGHDAFDLIGALGLINVAFNLERSDEYAGPGLIAAAELGATICASAATGQTVHSPEEGGEESLRSPFEAAYSVQDRLIASVLISGPVDERHATADTVYHRFFGQTRTIRNDRFDHQEHELLMGLFGPNWVSARCRTALGFDAYEAFAIWDAIAARLEAFYNSAFSGVGDPPPGIGDALAVVAEDLAGDAGLPEPVVARFLDTFSVSIGDVPAPQRTDDGMLIRRRPLVRDGDRFICTVPSNLLRAIRPALEEALKATSGWESYQRHRGSYCESRAVGILTDFLRPDLSLSKLSFEAPGGTGECDALILIDDTAVIVEVKSGALRVVGDPSRPERLDWTVRDMIGRPATQLERARAALLAGAQMRDPSGPIAVPSGHIRRVLGVIVTLEPLPFAAPMLWRLQDEGMLGEGPTLPWVIGLHELESICLMLEFPCQLLHFLDAHQRMDQLRCVEATDEIDVFMAYLDMGLRFGWLPDAERILLRPDSDQLNNWVFYKRGARSTVTPRPQQYFPVPTRLATRAELRRADRDRPGGFVSSSFEVIDAALDEADIERVGHPVPRNIARRRELPRRRPGVRRRRH